MNEFSALPGNRMLVKSSCIHNQIIIHQQLWTPKSRLIDFFNAATCKQTIEYAGNSRTSSNSFEAANITEHEPQTSTLSGAKRNLRAFKNIQNDTFSRCILLSSVVQLTVKCESA
jgi:hypothetical protein